MPKFPSRNDFFTSFPFFFAFQKKRKEINAAYSNSSSRNISSSHPPTQQQPRRCRRRRLWRVFWINIQMLQQQKELQIRAFHVFLSRTFTQHQAGRQAAAEPPLMYRAHVILFFFSCCSFLWTVLVQWIWTYCAATRTQIKALLLYYLRFHPVFPSFFWANAKKNEARKCLCCCVQRQRQPIDPLSATKSENRIGSNCNLNL